MISASLRVRPLLRFPVSHRALSTGTEIPINYMHGQPHPVVKPKEEYPEWLWKIDKSPTLGALEKKYNSLPDGFDGLSLLEQRRVVQLMNKRDIKDDNLERST
eukprot:CAMPEP_0182459552 /NCGR_PEP_ID=MMETSP1319-20130603/4654_1 /TAXON_ID=172717 /ORGANISM="Bolidomonas pacifica, Strain RCC208" /LENGTH=102 /DNA_ID=CAMNT_0024658495 /DNA_START=157 /DNA_END=465 /DNA_ORIENTATION=+